MIVPDKNYDVMRPGVIDTLIRTYRENQKKHINEKWDCDDIARDFWCFAKRVVSDKTEENVIVGRVIFRDHAEIICVKKIFFPTGLDLVYYIDQRDWSIRKPNKKPKWIEM